MARSRPLPAVLCLLTTAALVLAQEESPCKGDGQVCVQLTACPQLANLTRKGHQPSPQDISALRKAHCGFNATEPKVCCVLEGEALERYQLAFQQSVPFFSGLPQPVFLPDLPKNADRPKPPVGQPARRPQTPRPQLPRPQASGPQVSRPQGNSGLSSSSFSDQTKAQQLSLLPLETCGAITQDRIIGGKRAELMELPWMARIGYGDPQEPTYNCGGSLISERYVLTAAHCISVRQGLVPVSVRLGEHDATTEEDCALVYGERVCAPPVVDVEVERIIRHENYLDGNTVPSNVKFHNDIALLRLARPVTFTTAVGPICLPVEDKDSYEKTLLGKKVTVAGWGRTANGPLATGSDVLMKVQIRVGNLTHCSAKYRDLQLNVVPEKQLCAGGEANADSCNGDSGGPLIHPGPIMKSARMIQYGIVSFGLSHCATPGTPGVYTRVSHYLPWVLSKLEP